ncbi:hypothetical protein [Azohydromonas sediminis]|uniref:hypothetical protein n=1 Tax=Azohydromonas sediminis TaxID=2259674 RepID=UPI0013C2BB85|nr:hypothetical protein [Azohydromonas sediminis]
MSIPSAKRRPPSRRRGAARWWTFALLGVTAVAVAIVVTLRGGDDVPPPALSYEELTGSVFVPPAQGPFRAPRVRELKLPPFAGAQSIWGATGRDFRGHIWVGVSTTGAGSSARLFAYDPATEAWTDHGSVVDRLRETGLARAGVGQNKIHSKIVPAADGWLYFASTDEEGESAQGDVPPRWGGHLWRIHPDRHVWQHLLATPEGLVAVSGVGRHVYALGYWGHVLHQFDTHTGQSRRVVVGSTAGHVSRNFLADLRGHAYVPRLRARADGAVTASLVEYDAELREVGETPLAHYLGRESPQANHGIVGLAYLPDGNLLFTTHVGHLYRIEPRAEGPARVTSLGPWPAQAPAYAPSLFALGGRGWVAGVIHARGGFQWAAAEPSTGVASAFPLELRGLEKVLLYGSVSRDNAGRAYVGGWAANGLGGQRPLLLQLDLGG